MPYPRDHSHYEDPEEYFEMHGSARGRIAGFEWILREAERRGGGPPMLDIGCGRGESLAAARGMDELGVDIEATFPPYHVVGWSPRALRAAFDAAGLEPVEIAGYPLSWIGGKAGYAVERITAPVRLSAGLIAWARRPAT
jgi:hypothetical protein